MSKGTTVFALVAFFTMMLGILAYQLAKRDEPLYNTVKERREAQGQKKLKKDIANDIQESLKKKGFQ